MTDAEKSVKMVVDRWNASIANLDKHLNAITDEQLEKEIAPGKNRGTYLLGHLMAVHDEISLLMDWGGKLFPELHEPYFKLADKETDQVPSTKELRAHWAKQNEFFREKFKQMKPEQWFEKHTAVSEGDFFKEPHRTKLNVLIGRISHLQYHTGQFALLN